ncbi:hypothetical protein ABPG74_009410 [Tetrahymena malaccensis]
MKTLLEKINKRNVAKSYGEDYVPSLTEANLFYLRYFDINWITFAYYYLLKQVLLAFNIRKPFLLMEIQQALINMDEYNLLFFVVEFIISQCIKLFIQSFNDQIQLKYQTILKQKIQSQIFEHILKMDISYFENNSLYEIQNLIIFSSDYIAYDILYSKVISIIDRFLKEAGQIYFFYSLSPKIFLTLLFLSFFASLIKYFLNKKFIEASKQKDKNQIFKFFVLNDIFSNIFLIKSFGTEEKEVQKMDQIDQKQDEIYKDLDYYFQIKNIYSTYITDILGMIIIFQAFLLKTEIPDQLLNISLILSEIVGYSCYIIGLTDKAFYFFTSRDNNNNNSYKLIGKLIILLNTQPKIDQDIYNSIGQTDLLKGQICFENVSFKYPKTKDVLSKMNQINNELNNNNNNQNSLKSNDDQGLSQNIALKDQQSERDCALKDITFSIKQGQFVSFVGMSGSGKSTIVKLIQRFYDIDSGTILMDNQNVKDIPISKLRRSIGIVSQDPVLFDNDIEYNITYGLQTLQYSQEELQHICDVSGVSEFVFDKNRFPQGLKTLIGTKGVKLSGGQKQRVAIARALMKKPSILILDEATSSLDAESEFQVQQYINQLVSNRGMTIILVAHRLSTIIKSDIIFVMENGQIKEIGQHSQLMEKVDGIYKNLFNLQVSFQNQKNFTSIK